MRYVLPFLFCFLLCTYLCDSSLKVVPLSPLDHTVDEFPYVGALKYDRKDGNLQLTCTGIAISPYYVLTCNHCTVNKLTVFETSNGVQYAVTDVVLTENLDLAADLALVRVDGPMIDYLPLEPFDVEPNTVFYGVGYGLSGRVLPFGPNGEINGDFIQVEDFTLAKRVFKNRIQAIENIERLAQQPDNTLKLIVVEHATIEYDLSNPDTLGSPIGAVTGEGIVNPGDSGGPVIIFEYGKPYLVGISYSRSQVCDNGKYSYIGSAADLMRISTYNWIRDTIGNRTP